jgi:hypothetical protein
VTEKKKGGHFKHIFITILPKIQFISICKNAENVTENYAYKLSSLKEAAP